MTASPGEWWVRPGSGYIAFAISADNVTLAEVLQQAEGAEANAYAMAAAKELLAACEATADLADEVESLPYPFKVRWRVVCETARAAMAKATPPKP